MKFKKLIFIFLSFAILIACVLLVILGEDAQITVNSAPAIVFGICSVVYAVIAFLSKEHGNAFLLGRRKLFIIFLRSLKDDSTDTDSDEYKKEFALSAFTFCAFIPLYIPIAFFAKNFYMTLSITLLVAILRILFTFVLVLIPRIIKNAQDKKRDRIKDEADRKEQERRESMGKWK